MDVGTLGDAFTEVMEQNRWSGRRLARELGTSQPWVNMVLNGQRDPGIGRSAEMLARVGWQLQLVPSEEDPVERRKFLLAAAGVAAGAALAEPRTANPYSDAGFVNALTARLAYNEEQLGGTPVAREAARHLGPVARAARSPGAGVRLQVAASGLCRQAALILNDARAVDNAQEAAATALGLGGAAGDPIAQARAYDTLSLITAYTSGGRAVEYARRGLELPDVPTSDRAILAARLGRGAALAKDEYGARGGLDLALELAELAPPNAEITGNVGIAFTDLRKPEKAAKYLDTAVGLSVSSPFLYSLYLSRQAKAAIAAQQADLAAQEMLRLVAVAPLVQSPRLGFHMRHISDWTAKWDGTHEIREAREALREVMM